jgi:hypothetical protein
MTLRRTAPLSLLALAAALTSACDDSANTPSKEGADQARTEPEGDSAEKPEKIAGKPIDGGDTNPAVKGQEVGSDEQYTVSVLPGDAKAGAESHVQVTVLPKEAWHMNLEYPTTLKLEPPSGVTLAKPELAKGDAKLTEETCEYDVGFTSTDAGEKVFKGKLKFAVCREAECRPVTEDIEFKVAVK